MSMRTLLAALAISLASTTWAAEYKLVTEAYPPFNYIEDGKYKGASIEQIELMMKDAHLA